MDQVVELDSDTECINELESLLRSFLKDDCRCEVLFGDILISLMEAVQNAIKHGNEFDEQKKVHLKMIQRSGRLELSVSDEGNGFDHGELPANPTEEHCLAECDGRGVYLMKSLSHDFCYVNSGRTVILKFNLNMAPGLVG